MATSQLTINRDDLRARAASRSAATEQARARMLENRAELRRRVEESLDGLEWEPATRRVKIRYWEGVRAGIGLLLAGPRGLVEGLRALSRLADDLTDRGNVLAERGRQVTDRIPPSRGMRRRTRLRTVGWATGAFSLGFVLGWILGTRSPSSSVYDPYDDVVPATRLPDAASNPNGDAGQASTDASSAEEGTGTQSASSGGDDGGSGSPENGG